MSQNQKKRSKLLIGAIMKAAASGSAAGLHPPGKIAAIAGLAGFVLRLFRSRETLPSPSTSPSHRHHLPGGPRGAARIKQGRPKGVRRKATAQTAVCPSAHPTATSGNQGGFHRG